MADTNEPFDPCADDPAFTDDEAAAICKMMATGENSREDAVSSAGAKSKYQFVPSTAHGAIVGIGAAKTKTEAEELWNECGTSTTHACLKLKDRMCQWEVQQKISRARASGVPINKFTMYMLWNQGAGGAHQLLLLAKQDPPKDIPAGSSLERRLKQQAWNVHGYDPNSAVQIQRMRKYLENNGYPLT